MAYEYIGKALSAISSISCEKADWAASHLSDLRGGELSSLDRQLDFGLLAFKMRKVETIMGGAGKSEIADWRRGVELLQRLNGTEANAAFDEQACRRFIINFNTNTRPVQPSGFYLKASNWAFASDAERAWTREAWREAIDALLFGARTAMLAQVDAGPARTLLEKWFGMAAPAAVEAKLMQVLAGANAKLIGICYEGNNASGGGRWPIRLRELAGGFAAAEVHASSAWGWSAPQAAMHLAIGFGPDFFNDKTRKSLVRAHDPTLNEMEVTRGGAVAHELTHALGRTLDVDAPDAVYLHLDLPLPEPGKRVKAYGCLVCAALGAVAPDLAITNADNYRLFCEDAVFSKPLA